MEYAQLSESLTEATQLDSNIPILWDSNNFCTVEALVKDGKAEQFRIVPLLVTEAPAINPITHRVQRNGCELVEGQWQYRWDVTALSAEEVQANQIAAGQAMQKAIVTGMDALFDTTAQARRYDNRITCALRAGYVGPFQAEGQAFATWLDTCNALAYTLLGEVQAGTRPMPATVSEALSLLPAMVWPT